MSSPIYLGPKTLLCNGINWVSRNGEQSKIIKNNEEKKPKTTICTCTFLCVDAMLACRLCLIHIRNGYLFEYNHFKIISHYCFHINS